MPDKLYDLGEMRNSMCCPGDSSKDKKEKHYQKVDFTDKQLPLLKGMKMDDKVTIQFVGEIKGVNEDYDDKDANRYSIEMHRGAIKSGVSEKEYLLMSEDEKDTEDEKSMKE